MGWIWSMDPSVPTRSHDQLQGTVGLVLLPSNKQTNKKVNKIGMFP